MKIAVMAMMITLGVLLGIASAIRVDMWGFGAANAMVFGLAHPFIAAIDDYRRLTHKETSDGQ